MRHPLDFLFLCSANMSRSPTAEYVARRHGFRASSAGTTSHAVRPLNEREIMCARTIVCMEQEHADALLLYVERTLGHVPELAPRMRVWGIKDDYGYCDPPLINECERLLAPFREARRRELETFWTPP